ncbi:MULTISPECIES: HupE/UreJ family protein [Marinobacter]|jgi:urease accessory protein|uniref:HupE/UreJ family protein n=2 Tax=Gammaproteobacteria TaxID=1236 RepID=UPI000948CB8E|nr:MULTISPECIES: HupE/UreJ family protein [Marinobacter]MBJ7302190.1 HupE/UreJ family protein [Marinobacter salarius]MCZ4283411.1 HupE/UreJ family protein [Marinobacter salarius]MDM8181375.1 HupE/UreJ family protein [Marinobacter salarius]OLF85879.1 urease accessory protein UreJ [Marinobacter sp. C18]RUT75639.1 HupE/UreJ family protein [Marinobacter sp. NP-6]|tara:strand:- start:6746 stop:7330 length:585 start_codon:yes stop_codon:yes gene_type:complete
MNQTTKLLVAAGLLLTATTAAAHTGHGAHAESGFLSGLLHPMLGLDHLLAMAAIGFWSVRQSNTMKQITPLFVIGGMVLGAGIAWAGMSLPSVETGITFSVLVAGILIATLAKLPTAVGGTLVGVFMLFHGFAHGTEMPAGATLAAYLAGFSMATLAITLVGRGLGSLLLRADSRFSRGIGGVLAVAGAYLAAA